MFEPSALPYCGVAQGPGALTWNLDPVLIAVLAAAACLHVGWLRRDRSAAFAATAGWAVAAAALISPLCNLSVSLFVGRSLQHFVLLGLAAPLLATSLARRFPFRGTQVMAGTAAFAVLLWAWHVPAVYDATFRSAPLYWTMHASLLAAAVWLFVAWSGRRPALPLLLVSVVATGVQTTALGALLTFAPRPLYAAHLATADAFGLTPLEDQQLGGLVMWVPAGLILVAYATHVIGRALQDLGGAAEAGGAARDPFRF